MTTPPNVTTIYCHLSDASDDLIDSAFSCPQDEDAWPRQVAIPSTDPRYIAFFEARTDLVKASMVQPGE